MVAVKSAGHAHGAGQFINGGKAMRVRAASLMRHQNIGPLALQVLVNDRKNRAAVRHRQAFSPEVAFAAMGQVLVRVLENGRCWGCPHFAPEGVGVEKGI